MICDSGFVIRDLGFRIWDSGFWIRDLGFGIWDSGFGIRDLGFGIWNFSFLGIPEVVEKQGAEREKNTPGIRGWSRPGD